MFYFMQDFSTSFLKPQEHILELYSSVCKFKIIIIIIIIIVIFAPRVKNGFTVTDALFLLTYIIYYVIFKLTNYVISINCHFGFKLRRDNNSLW